ncbi:M15 family metallopeptidase [Candidatus Dactylopiibacterium carminicum]|uniref:M15 family metallopeptidase n=1 Tax=Candidatus Dactylopiibacterium carminicum TaxID=857335 RepID=UPI001482E319|nr:M15 family metallopeptidase [Candidatus Dactylopiibacterium carminicum]
MLDAAQLTGRSDSHVREFQFSDDSGFFAHPEAALAFLRLREAAAAERIDLRPASVFRSFDGQLRIWRAKWQGLRPLYDADGQPMDHASLSEAELIDAILEWSALPGASRHHWGSEFDVFDLAAMPADYRLQLLPAEYAPEGVFAYLNAWLDRNMARFGFFRPYDCERGGLHVEPWHLSYAPVSVPALAALTPALIREALLTEPIDGQALLLERIDSIHARQVCLVGAPATLA